MNGLDPAGTLVSGTALKLPSGTPGAATTGTTTPAPTTVPQAAPYASSGTTTSSEIGSIAAQHGVPSSLASAIAWQESGFNRIGISPPVFNLMQFGRYPLTIYDAWVRFALSFVIPFAFASFYPTARFLHRPEFRLYFWSVPAVAAVSLAIALSLWRSGVARYHSTGS
jgi:hypothetical protein